MRPTAERVAIAACVFITIAGSLFLVAVWQAKARADCFHHEHEPLCPTPSWLERHVDDVLQWMGWWL